MRLAFTIFGAPRTKKNHNVVVFTGKPCPTAIAVCRADRGKPCRLCKRGHHPHVLPAAEHKAWFTPALLQARIVRARVMPRTLTEQVNVAAVFWRDAYRGDALGYFQALGDLLQAAKIVENDEQCVTWDGSRLEKDASRPRIDVVITNAVPAPARR